MICFSSCPQQSCSHFTLNKKYFKFSYEKKSYDLHFTVIFKDLTCQKYLFCNKYWSLRPGNTFWHTLIWTKWIKVSPFEPVCVWFCNKLHFMSVCVADSHLINEDIWFPEDFSRNCDMSNSTKLIRVPWDAFIIPYLQ